MALPLFPPEFDDIYFADKAWSDRLDEWKLRSQSHGFSAGNAEVVEETLARPETGLRVVVNIGADALVSFLKQQRYLNAYEMPRVGGGRSVVSETREQVDDALDLGDDTYFGAVALGGTGVRYYGEYCMVIDVDDIDDDTRLFDRDSYDIVIEPLSELMPLSQEQVDVLSGTWGSDRGPMVAMKVLPELVHDRRLVTTGTISDTVLRDQEFVEVHMSRTFGPSNLEEIRVAPDEVTLESRLEERRRSGRPLTKVEEEWLRRREVVDDELDRLDIRQRVVTMHGRGYQWR